MCEWLCHWTQGTYRTEDNLRGILRSEWTALKNLLRYQPLDQIKDYFGVKIALYFAWLGFYTHTLIYASVVGLLCFLYGVVTLSSNIPSQDICLGRLNVTMCPICDYAGELGCNYWQLGETCFHSRAAYLFDNNTTVFFAAFMSFWAALFLEMWKRYSAQITHRWDLTGFDYQEDYPRPEYLARLAHVTTKKVPFTSIFLPFFFVYLTILKMLT